MHVAYRYHCEGPHTLYYNHRHALLFLSLSLSVIKNAPQNQQPDPAYDFRIFKKQEISSKSCEKQRSYSNFSNGVKIAKFSEIVASRTPNFRLFKLFMVILKVHDERNRMALVPSKPAG